MMRKTTLIKCMFVFLFAFSYNLFAQDVSSVDPAGDMWDQPWDDDESALTVSGFVQFAFAKRTKNDSLFNDSTTLNELQLHLDTNYLNDDFEVSFNFDAWVDKVTNQLENDVRELSIKFTAFDNTDVRIGRQIITWGTGDLLFINDQFPKDWVSPFSGKDNSYLKAPSDSLFISSYFKVLNIDFVWTPVFTPDRHIRGNRISFFSPLAEQQIGPESDSMVIRPDKNFKNGEFALRLHKSINRTEYAAYFYRGFDKKPVGITEQFQATYHRKNSYGFSVRGTLGNALYNIETGYYDSVEDPKGDNPFIQNSQLFFLLGYEIEVLPKLNLSLQYLLEKNQNYQNLIDNSLYPTFELKEKRHVYTTRLTYLTLQDKLTWSFYAMFSPTDNDSWIRPRIDYRANDNWIVSIGANLFEGTKPQTALGQFEDASNTFLRLRYYFQ